MGVVSQLKSNVALFIEVQTVKKLKSMRSGCGGLVHEV